MVWQKGKIADVRVVHSIVYFFFILHSLFFFFTDYRRSCHSSCPDNENEYRWHTSHAHSRIVVLFNLQFFFYNFFFFSIFENLCLSIFLRATCAMVKILWSFLYSVRPVALRKCDVINHLTYDI